ncbi:hypothetical protein IFM89_017411 [Coptis chinensis]|uniref:HMG box domain-containing protein n=1 Tax=Coptis chinensis TaxID=261450 RepID=A0A835LVQ6_9MAGN|nr:hypothetical protein IFM89_017411 [Coptis chinensis]
MSETEPEKKGKNKKKQDSEKKKKKKRPCAAYALWCKDQWNEEVDEEIKKKKKTQKDKDPLKPKRSLLAFSINMNKRQAALVEQNNNVPEIGKIAGEEWKNMSEEQRKPYEEKTKEKHHEKKKQKDEQKSDPNKPKRPASSFILFSKEMRKNLVQERPEISNATLNALISVKWKELNETEKEIWNNIAANAMNAYKKEMQEYNSQKIGVCETRV